MALIRLYKIYIHVYTLNGNFNSNVNGGMNCNVTKY